MMIMQALADRSTIVIVLMLRVLQLIIPTPQSILNPLLIPLSPLLLSPIQTILSAGQYAYLSPFYLLPPSPLPNLTPPNLFSTIVGRKVSIRLLIRVIGFCQTYNQLISPTQQSKTLFFLYRRCFTCYLSSFSIDHDFLLLSNLESSMPQLPIGGNTCWQR